MAKGIRYDEDTKQDTVARWKAGENPHGLAKEIGIHYTTLYDWKMKLKNKKGKRRMTKPKPKVTISNGVSREVTELKRTIIELSADLQFWQNYTLKLIREKESQ